ncbi:putative esterase [Roseobacter sp. SK209-2-6]|uniref:alpha/beta hydrolase-fold protein n=1 Tax=Roseobacter sp. SK209-2-6 TaxID=388739 RepID=UPI0000F3EDFC|nr:alpha/beta hydrolase-fold protein [Roseobacter sp. SK209-2-6]EBA15609.1 putative esterase [Roseobacter sp. SK209-2-6]
MENVRPAWIWPEAEPLPSPWLRGHVSQKKYRQGGVLFWQAISQLSCPVVEDIEPDPQGRLCLTFLWQGGDQSHPWLIGGPSVDHLPLWQIKGSDIWFRTIWVPQDLVLAYRFAQIPPSQTKTQDAFRAAVRQSVKPDSLNPDTLSGAWQGHQEAFSTIDLPRERSVPPTRQPLLNDPGHSHHFAFHSRLLNAPRDIYIQTPPPCLAQAEPQRLLFLLDGERCKQVLQLPEVLASAQISGQIPATTVVYVGAGQGASRAQELGCNPAFARALSCELLPQVEQVLGRSFAPAQTQIAGASLGGLAALHTALLFPEKFQQVIALSGSFWWSGFAELRSATDLRQLRARFSVGCYERGGLFERPDLVAASQRVAKNLQTRGAEAAVSIRSGGHDPALWRQSLLQDLVSLS